MKRYAICDTILVKKDSLWMSVKNTKICPRCLTNSTKKLQKEIAFKDLN